MAIIVTALGHIRMETETIWDAFPTRGLWPQVDRSMKSVSSAIVCLILTSPRWPAWYSWPSIATSGISSHTLRKNLIEFI